MMSTPSLINSPSPKLTQNSSPFKRTKPIPNQTQNNPNNSGGGGGSSVAYLQKIMKQYTGMNSATAASQVTEEANQTAFFNNPPNQLCPFPTKKSVSNERHHQRSSSKSQSGRQMNPRVAEEYQNLLMSTAYNAQSDVIFFDPKSPSFVHPHQKNSRIMLASVEMNPGNKRFKATKVVEAT